MLYQFVFELMIWFRKTAGNDQARDALGLNTSLYDVTTQRLADW